MASQTTDTGGGRPRVVIAGAGFAGLAAAKRLAGRGLDVTLIDRENYHLFTPLLYQVASSLLNPGDIAQPVRAIVGKSRDIRFRQAEIAGFDLDRRVVLVDAGEIPYDYLVVAVGSATNFFGNHTIEACAQGLKDLPEALALRNQVLSCFERAAWEDDAAKRAALLTFVVVGGGPTGVEYAGALSELINLVQTKDYPALDFREVQVILVEAEGALLQSFAPPLRRSARSTLERKGVRIRLGSAVRDAEPGRVVLTDGSAIATETLVWAAGVAGSPLGSALSSRLARGGRVPVGPGLQVAGHPEVFVAGDLAGFEQDARLVPQLAEVALGQGRAAAENIVRLAAGEPVRRYRYRSRGIMATIGRNAAVAQLGPLHLRGFAGWVTWLFVHLVLLIGFRNRLLVLFAWAWAYLFYDRPVRIAAAARRRG